jgi:uncharacterized protein (DUF849 family)
MSTAPGGKVRVGLEDSLFIGRGKLAASEELGLAIATPDEARFMLELKASDKVKF